MLRLPRVCSVFVAAASLLAVTTVTAGSSSPLRHPLQLVQPHAAFDETIAPAPAHWVRGAPVGPLKHPRVPLLRGAGASGLAPSTGSAPDPEVLGFAQVGEVTSGAWTTDLRFDLLSTVAYFGLNVNANGTLVNNDSGWAGWWSSELTNLMNVAHGHGDRVVLTVKTFDNGTIASVTGSESARQLLISQIIGQLRSRGGDGVNIDFEGTDSSVSANFTTFVGELYTALRAQVPQQSYLTVDTYAAAGMGGTMYDLSGLIPHLDAFDLMGYGFASGNEASPTAPLHGDWYNVTQAVTDYLTTYGVPRTKLILGVPYYGYKWSVGNPNPGNDGMQPGTNTMADTYAGALADFACAEQLKQFWDPTFDEPYATWYSPKTGDPCGGDWGSYRELYYDNAPSLGDKYDLVNADGLRGIGIWALGYDSGSNDLWNEIALKFSVTHGPSATVSPLPQSESTMQFTVSWSLNSGSPAVARYVLWVQPDNGSWVAYTTTTATSSTMYGFPGHHYGFYVEALGAGGAGSGPGGAQASTSVNSNAPWTYSAFHTLYAVEGSGALQPGASPPIDSASFSWDIARGMALDSSAEGGAVLDGYGALHTFGDASTVNTTGYWRGWDIATGLASNASNQGYVLDGWGGVHPFSIDGAALPPAPAHTTGYWAGWKIARGIALFGDGSGGVVLDGWGGIHPFTVAGAPQPGPVAQQSYWPGWDIARSVVLIAGSTATHFGGYVLDGWGGLHPFGTAGDVPPAITGTPFWGGWDIARAAVLLPNTASAGYVVDGWGGMHAFGGAPDLNDPTWTPGADLTRGLAIR